jgi:heme/copper-type cytochrome/quinol oxidase subunit 4
MTDGKEIIAYAAAHLAGYVLSAVLWQVVLVPIMVATEVVRSMVATTAISFLMFAIVQVGVFLLFLAMRGRRAAG